MPVLESLGTAVPGEAVPQTAIKAKAAEIVAAVAPDLAQYLGVFESTGIKTRYLLRPLDWYLGNHGWKERSEIYRDDGMRLLEQAAREALSNASLQPTDIDGVVLVSTTGISTPSLDARLANKLGLRSDIQRTPVWGLGCAGGVAGLSLAADLARAHPDRRYLLLSLELCSLAFHLGDLDVRSFVAATLFGDGAAAAIIRGDACDDSHSLSKIGQGAAHEWPDSENVMGWNVLDEGLSVVFSRKIPEIVERDLAPVVRGFMNGDGRPDRYVFHPGGTKVLQAYEAALRLGPNELESARTVLRDYGNMSSPTVLFTLKESLREPMRKDETALLAALGPGFASELLLLEG